MKKITAVIFLLTFFGYVYLAKAQQIPVAPINDVSVPVVSAQSVNQGDVLGNKKKKSKGKKAKVKKTKTKKTAKSKNVKSKHSAQFSLKIQ